MTDRELIENYIEKNFRLTHAHNGFIFIDRLTDETMLLVPFLAHLRGIFNDLISYDAIAGKKIGIGEIYEDWLEKKKAELVKDLYDYLKDCTLHSGLSNWHVYHKFDPKSFNREVTASTLNEIFQNKYDIRFIEYFFDDWRLKKAVEITEKELSKF